MATGTATIASLIKAIGIPADQVDTQPANTGDRERYESGRRVARSDFFAVPLATIRSQPVIWRLGFVQGFRELTAPEGLTVQEAGRRGAASLHASATTEQFSEWGKKGAAALNAITTPEQRREWGSKGGKANVAKHGPAHFERIGAIGGEKTKEFYRANPGLARLFGSRGGRPRTKPPRVVGAVLESPPPTGHDWVSWPGTKTRHAAVNDWGAPKTECGKLPTASTATTKTDQPYCRKCLRKIHRVVS